MRRFDKRSGLNVGLVAVMAMIGATVSGYGCSDRSTLIAEPASGGLNGGYEVKLRGVSFADGTIVSMDGKRITDVVYVSEGMIRFKAPPADSEGSVDIVIANAAGERTLYEKVFRYEKTTGVDVVDAFEKSASDEKGSAKPAGDDKATAAPEGDEGGGEGEGAGE